MKTIALALTFPLMTIPALAAEKRFAEATETNEELIRLYEEAGDLCLRNPSRDVRVIVACETMSIYGQALNERGWCYGRKDQAFAFMEWHECGKDSLRHAQSQDPGSETGR